MSNSFGFGGLYFAGARGSKPVPPFPANAANNGLSVDSVSGKIVLGQTLGDATDPAVLLNNRSIPMNGNSFRFINTTALNQKFFLVDPASGLYQLGDINGVGNNSAIDIDDSGQVFDFRTGGQRYLLADVGNRLFQFGKITATAANPIFFQMDNAAKTVELGDVNNLLSGTNLHMSLNSNSWYLGSFNQNKNYIIAFSTGEFFFVDSASAQKLVLGNGTNQTKMLAGDQKTQVRLNDTAAGGTAEMGDPLSLRNNNFIRLDDINGAFITKASDAVLIHTLVTLSNGAAAAVGTLTNAPAAGDPTKWIAIDDNGTTRFVPAW